MSLFLQEPDIYYTPNIILSTYLRNYWATSHPLFCTESLESGVHFARKAPLCWNLAPRKCQWPPVGSGCSRGSCQASSSCSGRWWMAALTVVAGLPDGEGTLLHRRSTGCQLLRVTWHTPHYPQDDAGALCWHSCWKTELRRHEKTTEALRREDVSSLGEGPAGQCAALLGGTTYPRMVPISHSADACLLYILWNKEPCGFPNTLP